MLVTEQWPIERLIPYVRNPRKNDAAVERMCDAIREFGFRIPVVARSDGTVVDGHLRLKAARALGLETVPVALADELTDAQIKAFRLLANRSASWADWDEDLLALELQDLQSIGFDLSLTGFDGNELDKLLDGDAVGLTDENLIPPAPIDPITKPGDLWILGDHRLLCGDAAAAADVDRLFDGRCPNLMVTDPPYGVNYDPAWRHKLGINTSTRVGKVMNDGRADWEAGWLLFPGNIAYVWHGALHASVVARSLERQEFNIRAQIIWAKERLVIGRGDYHWQHEPCWYAVREKGHWAGDRKQTTLWTIASGGQDTETAHGTQKPVECMRRPIVNNSERGDWIYDPFVGSGTTLIAAETVGRSCLAMELDPVYCDVAVARWEAFAGRKAERQLKNTA